jgi:hypothetical protein
MRVYDNRRITLDPGLTALTLRGLHRPNGHYPFIERHTRWRRFRVGRETAHHVLAAWFPTVRWLFEARSTPR